MIISVDVQEMSHILKTRGEGLKQESFIYVPQTGSEKSIHWIDHIIWSIKFGPYPESDSIAIVNSQFEWKS